MIKKMLSTSRTSVRGAKNGNDAIEIAQEFNPEIILMDMRMPVMDGLEATKRLRAMKKFSEIPIIALTADTGECFIKEQIAAGCTEHLAKPFEKEKLFKILKKYLKKKS
jgi:CheY-like chemotaxis protein